MNATARPRANPRAEPTVSDAEWEASCKTWYERKRLTDSKLRKAEAARRKAGEPPPTLYEALERDLRALQRGRIDTLARPFASHSHLAATSQPPQATAESNLAALAALFDSDPVLTELGEAAA